MDRDQWFQTDEAEDVVASLKILRDCIQRVQIDAHYWKWIVLSAHSAVQGAIVCHLSGSMQIGALTKTSATNVVNSLEAGFERARKEERMASPREMFRRLSDQAERLEMAGEVFDCSAEETFFGLICDLRDEFTHFTPKHWVLGLSALPMMIEILVRFIERVAQMGWAFRHINVEDVLTLTAQIEETAAKMPLRESS